MPLALLFHYLLLNMFRMLIHPSSGACDLFDDLFHGLYCSGTMCVGVTVWFVWGGVVSGLSGWRPTLLGTPKGMLSKVLEMGVCLHRGPLLKNVGGRSFPRAFERRGKISLLSEFLWWVWEICRKRRCKCADVFIGPCWGTWRGFVYWDFLREKETAYLCSSLLDPEDMKR